MNPLSPEQMVSLIASVRDRLTLQALLNGTLRLKPKYY